MNILTQVIIFSISSFGMLFVIAKLLGKKQIAELDFIDYAVGISLGSISAQWATDVSTPWYHYAIALIIYTILSISITHISRKTPFFKKFLQGSPIVLINDGDYIYQNLKKSKLSVNDVLGMCRNQGYFNMQDVSYAILETNGNLSILPKASKRPLVACDLPNCKIEKESLPQHIIIDGVIYLQQLNALNKDKTWLISKLPKQLQDNLHEILLATYDEKTDSVRVYEKNKIEKIVPIK